VFVDDFVVAFAGSVRVLALAAEVLLVREDELFCRRVLKHRRALLRTSDELIGVVERCFEGLKTSAEPLLLLELPTTFPGVCAHLAWFWIALENGRRVARILRALDSNDHLICAVMDPRVLRPRSWENGLGKAGRDACSSASTDIDPVAGIRATT
jgi:hypothetical protein